jgi:nicotinate phosphoribosyltransferase
LRSYFKDTQIVASNDLNEETIASIKAQGAPIDVWGVGTQLSTGGSQAALGGVYKVVASQAPPNSCFVPKIKISDNADKITNPGRHQVR